MKKSYNILFFLLIHSLFFYTPSFLSASTLSDSECAKLVQVKSAVKVIGVDTYLLEKKFGTESIFLVYEKVNDGNIDFWKSYVGVQINMAQKLTDYRNTGAKNYNDSCWLTSYYGACLGSNGGLAGIICSYKIAEVWVAYICTQNITSATKKICKFEDWKTVFPKTEETFAGIDNIEIAMGVITSPDTPFFTHMGSARSVYRTYHSIEPRHSGISAILQGWAAVMQNILCLDHSKPYMVNQTLSKMRQILENTFSSDVCLVRKEEFERKLAKIENSKDGKDRSNEISSQIERIIKDASISPHSEEDESRHTKRIRIIQNPMERCWIYDHWFFQVGTTSLKGDPIVILNRFAMIRFFLDSLSQNK